MKVSTPVLWQLIKNMNRSEKLFFKKEVMALKNGEAPLYMKLFDCLARQKNFDEQQVLKELYPGISKKNIAFQKHYLYRLLNSSLIEYDNRGNSEQKIYQNIQLIRVKRKKGLLDEALV